MSLFRCGLSVACAKCSGAKLALHCSQVHAEWYGRYAIQWSSAAADFVTVMLPQQPGQRAAPVATKFCSRIQADRDQKLAESEILCYCYCCQVTPGYRLGMRKPRYAGCPWKFMIHTTCGLSACVTSMICEMPKLTGSLLSNSMSPLERAEMLPPQSEKKSRR